MSSKGDKEITAMQDSLAALVGLEQEEQRRVLAWLANKLNLGNGGASFPTGSSQTGSARTGAATSPPGIPSAKNFFVEKRPATDVERITCLAYYLTHFRGAPQFKTKQLTELSKEAAQPKFSNAAVAVQNATVQNQFLSQAGQGQKQITARGEAFVEALPDREKAKTALDASPLRGHRKSKNASGRSAKAGRTR
jgi:hypothetical protein